MTPDGERLATLESLLTAANDKLDKLLASIYGNGREGLLVRVDRLEQDEGRRKWGVRLVAASVVGLIVKAFWGVVAK